MKYAKKKKYAHIEISDMIIITRHRKNGFISHTFIINNKKYVNTDGNLVINIVRERSFCCSQLTKKSSINS